MPIYNNAIMSKTKDKQIKNEQEFISLILTQHNTTQHIRIKRTKSPILIAAK